MFGPSTATDTEWADPPASATNQGDAAATVWLSVVDVVVEVVATLEVVLDVSDIVVDAPDAVVDASEAVLVEVVATLDVALDASDVAVDASDAAVDVFEVVLDVSAEPEVGEPSAVEPVAVVSVELVGVELLSVELIPVELGVAGSSDADWSWRTLELRVAVVAVSAVGGAVVASAGVEAGGAEPSGGVVDAADDGPCGAVGAAAAGGAADVAGATPTVSVTTGSPANRSTGVFVREIPDVPARLYVSDATGTRRWTTLEAAGRLDARDLAVDTGGNGASRCTAGTRNIGNLAAGSVSEVSGVVDTGIDGCRNAAPIGPTYMRTSTASPTVAHQYRIPRKRIAVNPNGCAAAIEA
jgi:hypothetical protein